MLKSEQRFDFFTKKFSLWKVFPLGGAMQNKDEENRPYFACISKLSNWGKCRRRGLLLSNKFKTAKRGFSNLKISKNIE